MSKYGALCLCNEAKMEHFLHLCVCLFLFCKTVCDQLNVLVRFAVNPQYSLVSNRVT